MRQNKKLRFSITVHTDDQTLISYLSVLAYVCQPKNKHPLQVEGEAGGEWERNGHLAVFYFSNTDHREHFVELAKQLYSHAWKIIGQNDDDPPGDSN